MYGAGHPRGAIEEPRLLGAAPEVLVYVCGI